MEIKISVIIIAHDRKIFLSHAVESVLHQSLSRGSYEILVVKHFIDNKFDEYLTKQGIKVITTFEESLGSKLVLGIERSNGNIISFLEDDDVFLENKLENVINSFSDEFLVYYHNNYSIINQQGSITKISMPYFKKSRNNNNLRINTNKICFNTIIKLDREGRFFNLSCISIKRSLVTKVLGSFRGINVAIDNFLFYLALDSGQGIFIDSEITTQYRIHALNNSLSIVKDKRKFTVNKIEFFRDDLMGFRKIQSISQNEVVKRYLCCRILIPEIGLCMLSHKDTEGKKLWNAILCSVRIRSVSLFLLVMLYLSTSLFPNLGLFLFYNYESCSINKVNK